MVTIYKVMKPNRILKNLSYLRADLETDLVNLSKKRES